ncbi:hypothetical protein KGQ74_02380 [Patescibacteria group bacterium]|nr:hypothetical protein [Patescibacteria group bacterium]
MLALLPVSCALPTQPQEVKWKCNINGVPGAVVAITWLQHGTQYSVESPGYPSNEVPLDGGFATFDNPVTTGWTEEVTATYQGSANASAPITVTFFKEIFSGNDPEPIDTIFLDKAVGNGSAHLVVTF